MGRACCFCRQKYEKASKRSYHAFPNDWRERDRWFDILGLEAVNTRGLFLCSDHFDPTSFHTQPQGRRVLKRGSLPICVPSKITDFELSSFSIAESSSTSDASGCLEPKVETMERINSPMADPLSPSSSTTSAPETAEYEKRFADNRETRQKWIEIRPKPAINEKSDQPIVPIQNMLQSLLQQKQREIQPNHNLIKGETQLLPTQSIFIPGVPPQKNITLILLPESGASTQNSSVILPTSSVANTTIQTNNVTNKTHTNNVTNITSRTTSVDDTTIQTEDGVANTTPQVNESPQGAGAKRRRLVPAYWGDIREEDLMFPKKAVTMWEMANSIMKKHKILLANLRHKVRRHRSTIEKLKNEVKYWKEANKELQLNLQTENMLLHKKVEGLKKKIQRLESEKSVDMN